MHILHLIKSKSLTKSWQNRYGRKIMPQHNQGHWDQLQPRQVGGSFSKKENKIRNPILIFLAQYSSGGFDKILGKKEIKGIRIGNEKVKLSYFHNDYMYRETEESPKSLLEFTNSIKQKGTKASSFHYITNKVNEEETMKVNPYKSCRKQNKLHLGNEIHPHQKLWNTVERNWRQKKSEKGKPSMLMAGRTNIEIFKLPIGSINARILMTWFV